MMNEFCERQKGDGIGEALGTKGQENTRSPPLNSLENSIKLLRICFNFLKPNF